MVAALHQKAQDKLDKLLDDLRCRWRLQQERRRRIAARILKSWMSLWPSARRMLKSVISPRKGGALREQVRAWYAFPIGVLTSLKRIDEWGGKARQICHLQLVLLTSWSTSNKNMSKNVKARLLQLFITVTPAARHSQAGTYVTSLLRRMYIYVQSFNHVKSHYKCQTRIQSDHLTVEGPKAMPQRKIYARMEPVEEYQTIRCHHLATSSTSLGHRMLLMEEILHQLIW